MDEKELRRYLNVIKRAVSLIESGLDNDDGGLLEKLASNNVQSQNSVQPQNNVQISMQSPVRHVEQIQEQPPSVQQQVSESQAQQTLTPEEIASQQNARKKHIDDLLAIDCWPEAVPQFLVAKDASADDQINRANAVLDMMLDRQVENIHFLDFGCGDGWIAQEIIKRGVASSTGYDVKLSQNWNKLNEAKFTDKYNELQQGHYDVIMLYDVIDHCKDPVFLMSQVKSLIKRGGSVYVRCHPWTSRHATHLYKQGINKSYFHLFLTYDEIKKIINQEPNFTRVEKNPVEAYHWWFKDFEIQKERFVKESVSEFFFVESFKELLANEQQIPTGQIDQFLDNMQIQFVDYKLQLK